MPITPRFAIRASIAATVACVAALATPNGAAAQGAALPTCPDDRLAVSVEFPVAIRGASTLAFTLQLQPVHPISDLTLVMRSDGMAALSEPLEASQSRIDIVRSVPDGVTSAGARIAWTQDAGTPAACSGVLDSGELPLVDANAKVGDPDVPRLGRRYRMKWRDRSPSTWTLRSRCAVFACNADFRSTGGLRGKIELDGERYSYSVRVRDGYCEIEYTDGTTSRRSIFVTRTFSMRVVESEAGIATRLKGTERFTYDIPSDDDEACDTPGSQVRGFTARLLG